MSRCSLAIALALGLAVALNPAAAGAATITVDTGGDAGSGCTLRNAIDSANADLDQPGCTATNLPYDNDTIQIPASIASPIQLASPLSVGVGPSNNDLTINGPGATALDVRGGASFRVFNISGTGTAVLSNLTISHGSAVGTNNVSGGGINFSANNLTLDHAVVSQNTATATGDSSCGAGCVTATAEAGGIYIGGGALTIRDSTISGNQATATATGGATTNSATAIASALNNRGGGPVTVERSTISGNTSTGNASGTGANGRALGGAAAVLSGSTTIKNSTLSGNQAIGSGSGAGFGGAIFTNAPTGITLHNDTITKNTANNGANVYNGGNTISFGSTIVSNPITGPNCSIGGGSNLSNGYNLEDTNTCGFNTVADQTNTATGLDPTLADNGGPTQTHALLPGSAAIDKGSSFGETLDQRGLGRFADFTGIANSSDAADVGAFERQPPALAPIGNRTVQAGQTLTFTTSATNPDPTDTLTFGATNLPSGASFNTGTQTFTWTPTAGQVGSFPGVLFSLSDGYAPYDDSEAITITVTAVPPPPPAGGGGSTGSTTTAPAGPTGQRAAALKKCKKKHGRARANCKKRANQLPV